MQNQYKRAVVAAASGSGLLFVEVLIFVASHANAETTGSLYSRLRSTGSSPLDLELGGD
jgi:hypothetical protein